MANRCWLNRIRGILLPASFVHLFFTITSGRFSFHCIRRNLLHPLRGSHSAFLSDLVRVRHDNAFSCPSPRRCCTCLSHIVSDSDVYASVSVSCSRSCPLTSAGFRSCGVPPGRSFGRQVLPHSRSAFPRMSHTLHCCQRSPSPLLPFRSAPGSGRFASMSTRSLMIQPSTLAVLPAPATVPFLGGATRTRHDGAISSKRLTVPCDSDFLCVSLIRDGLASQHARLPCSHNGQHSFLGQIFCCPRCVLTCMQRFRVCLASLQPSFLQYRWFHCWRACPSSFPGCPHVMLHQCFIDISSSPRRLRDRRRCFL